MENNISRLVQIKQALGPVQILDFSDVSTEKFYRLLGAEVKSQVVKILNAKLSLMSEDEIFSDINKTKLIWESVYERLQSSTIDKRITNALEEYIFNLKNWSEGAELNLYTHPALEKLLSHHEGYEINSTDLALFLQNDETGCQTGILRNTDGSIMLWHTEEDFEQSIGDRFDQLRIVKFNMPDDQGENVITYSFIYPDLLPGPAISWREDGYVQAVDSLLLKNISLNNAIIANIACWITLRLGKSVKAEESITALGPYLDGYAIAVVTVSESLIHGKVVEFAGENLSQRDLSFQPNSFLFQVNQLSAHAQKIAEKYEEVDPLKKQEFNQRLLRTNNAIEGLISGASVSTEQFENLLCSLEGNDFAYSNEDVKSNFFIRVNKDEIFADIGSGPRLSGDEAIIIELKLDTRK